MTKETLILRGQENWIHLGTGRHRKVWLLPSGYVLKEGTSPGGKAANVEEARIWKERHNLSELINCRAKASWKLARCRLIPRTLLLVMEFVWPTGGGGESQRKEEAIPHFPKWTNRFFHLNWRDLPGWCNNVDCEQVGFNRQGNLVAYDYAD